MKPETFESWIVTALGLQSFAAGTVQSSDGWERWGWKSVGFDTIRGFSSISTNSDGSYQRAPSPAASCLHPVRSLPFISVHFIFILFSPKKTSRVSEPMSFNRFHYTGLLIHLSFIFSLSLHHSSPSLFSCFSISVLFGSFLLSLWLLVPQQCPYAALWSEARSSFIPLPMVCITLRNTVADQPRVFPVKGIIHDSLWKPSVQSLCFIILGSGCVGWCNSQVRDGIKDTGISRIYWAFDWEGMSE